MLSEQLFELILVEHPFHDAIDQNSHWTTLNKLLERFS